jgi:glycine oxidase
MPQTADVVVIGGGVIGAAIAWRLAVGGASVVVADPAPGSGATGTAAGMLAPVTELHYGEEPLLRLNLAAARRYPGFVAELTEASGVSVGYRRTGTLAAAWDGADLAALRDLHEFQRSLGLNGQMLSGADLRGLEPSLAPGLPGGLYAGDDHAVDPRRLHAALVTAAERAGARLERQRVQRVEVDEHARGVVLDDGTKLIGACVVLAAGSWSGSTAGLPAGIVPPVRPVKGQTLRLRLDTSERLTHVTRGTVRGSPVYLVPREDGELVVGASAEEAGFDLRARSGAIYELLRDAQALLPAVLEMEWVEVSTGLRPGTPDNAPIIGSADVDGLVIATGHFRNGILLAPVTADAVQQIVLTGSTPEDVRAFAPQRFAGLVRPT